MKRDITIVLLVCCTIFNYCTTPKTSRGNEMAVVDSLSALIPRLIKEADIPGLSLALIRDGKLYWTGNFGVANKKTNTPVTDSTVFEAASLGKPVFAYAVLMLADKNVIDLNKPMIEYLQHSSKFSDPRINKITAKMVLSHQTGLPNWRGSDSLRTYFEPGGRFSYSGEGINLLQKAVEEILKRPLDQIMKELVFEPFQMTSSSFSWQPGFDRLKALPHNELMEVGNIRKTLEAGAASTLHTTASDYGKFLAAALKGQGLKNATFQQMVSVQSQIDENCINCLQIRKSPSISKNLFWGLGWGIQQTDKGPAIWHWGDNGASKGYAVGLLNEKDGVVFFTNGTNGLSITEELIDAALNISQPSVKWIAYEPYNTLTRKLLRSIVTNKEKAVQELKGNVGRDSLSSEQYNWIGQQLYNRNMYTEAIELYLLSLQKNPQSLSAIIGIAQSYTKLKEKPSALKYYKMALALSAENKEIADIVAQLEKPEVKVDAKILDMYVGRYSSPLGVLNVSIESQVLHVELEGESKEELVAESETKFYAPGVKAYFTFSDEGKSKAKEMIIEIGGQKITAKRLADNK